jgi:hypothetical protein
VRLGAAAVVRLVRTLAHEFSPCRRVVTLSVTGVLCRSLPWPHPTADMRHQSTRSTPATVRGGAKEGQTGRGTLPYPPRGTEPNQIGPVLHGWGTPPWSPSRPVENALPGAAVPC